MNTQQYHKVLVRDYESLLSMVQERGLDFQPVFEDPENADNSDLVHECLQMRWLLRTPSSRN
jgi:hypothetical protein